MFRTHSCSNTRMRSTAYWGCYFCCCRAWCHWWQCWQITCKQQWLRCLIRRETVSRRMKERELELRKQWLQRNNMDRSGLIFLLINRVGTLMHIEGIVSEKEPFHLATVTYLHTPSFITECPNLEICYPDRVFLWVYSPLPCKCSDSALKFTLSIPSHIYYSHIILSFSTV